MKKYFLVIANTFSEYFVYRLNFILWRVRMIMSILISYYLWMTVFRGRVSVFNYGTNQMITYILLTIFVNSVVLSTKTFSVALEINLGILSNYLIRPINYFVYYLSRDAVDKVINTIFSLVELVLLFYILKPPIFVQTNTTVLLFFGLFLMLAAVLYFEINMILSFIGFWSRETWAPRFLFFILVSFLAGNYFPLDIIPRYIYAWLEYLPFTYLVFFPLKVYLGNISLQFIQKGFVVVITWIILLFISMHLLWRRGLKQYTAEGQ